MQAAQLCHPAQGFENMEPVWLRQIEAAYADIWEEKHAEVYENDTVCAACGHGMFQVRAGLYECSFCDVVMDLRDE